MTNSVYYGNRRKPSPIVTVEGDDIPMPDDEQSYASERMVADMNKLLFSDPGAGKTLTALDALVRLVDDGKEPAVVVMCPQIATYNWASWITSIYKAVGADSIVQVITGNRDRVRHDATHIIVTYGTLSRERAPIIGQIYTWKLAAEKRNKATVLICDESDNLNTVQSNRTVTVLGQSSIFADFVYRWFLTGTPIPRYQDGLWPVLNSAFKARLTQMGVDKYEVFLNTFCYQRLVKYGKMYKPKSVVSGNKNMPLMQSLLYGGTKPIAIRNKLVLRDKPIIKQITLDVRFSLDFLNIEEQALDTPVFDDAQVISPVLSKAMAMLGKESSEQVAEYVVEQIEQKRKAGDRKGILLLYWHKEVGQRIVELLNASKITNRRIGGDTSQKDRDDFAAGFNTGSFDVLVGQIKAMGVALNLQSNCDHVIFAEDTYSHAANLQAYQRVWRRGQKHVVKVDYCRTLSPLSAMRAFVAEKKGVDATKILDKVEA